MSSLLAHVQLELLQKCDVLQAAIKEAEAAAAAIANAGKKVKEKPPPKPKKGEEPPPPVIVKEAIHIDILTLNLARLADVFTRLLLIEEKEKAVVAESVTSTDPTGPGVDAPPPKPVQGGGPIPEGVVQSAAASLVQTITLPLPWSYKSRFAKAVSQALGLAAAGPVKVESRRVFIRNAQALGPLLAIVSANGEWTEGKGFACLSWSALVYMSIGLV